MVADIVVELVHDTERDERATEFEPIARVPPQWRREVEFRVLERFARLYCLRATRRRSRRRERARERDRRKNPSSADAARMWHEESYSSSSGTPYSRRMAWIFSLWPAIH